MSGAGPRARVRITDGKTGARVPAAILPPRRPEPGARQIAAADQAIARRTSRAVGLARSPEGKAVAVIRGTQALLLARLWRALGL